MLAKYDRQIQEYRTILKEDPTNEDAKDEIGDITKTKAFVRVMAKQFVKYKASQN